MRERLVLWAYSAGWRLVRSLPERSAYLVFSVLAEFTWMRQGAGVRQLEKNLERVLPGASPMKIKTVSRKGMHSYMRYWCDAFRLPDWSSDRILATCRAEGDAPVREALAAGRGVVMALSHSGNWDHAGAWSTLAMARVTTVAERLRPEELYERFLDFRKELGMEVLPHDGGGEVFGTLVRRLRTGGFVPLLADRDLTASGVPVQIFGDTARMAAGPASLALVADAALFPVSIRYERLKRAGAPARWGTVIHFHPEVVAPSTGQRATKVQAMTQACADALAAGIAAHPEDWHMLQRVFVADYVSDIVPETPGGAGATGGPERPRRAG
ncbi:phosphatidylinositol mannoside acyltransferase [Kineosporia sp. A_224]|uniref:phosphatidylinositol mannoside acyltransferase n=1 Tax=Kineosporia sp. A_224 TaxID=1962180 RepID=UPI000B4A7306|nr:phosphatidylinositol mannoside acyltransferase [Kineosporia sp. A_224]